MKKYLDEVGLQDFTTKLTAKYRTIFAARGEAGTPIPVETVAEMTDEDQIYVYTGSETGYTAGNWYYWDGTAWTSGGSYGAGVTDDTLSIAGRAADAKATGDAIHVTQEMIAPREASSTASKNYAVGDYLVYNGKLYKVTSAIASGGTISSSNTEETTVTDELANGSGGGVDESALTSVEPWYTGTDLTTKFADEITSYGGDPWAWIKARITAGNFAGIHVNDYIPFTTTNGISEKAYIAGINTYKGLGAASGDPGVGNHIDFITNIWNSNTSGKHKLNQASYNNGLIPVETITGDGTTTSFVLTRQMNDVATVKAGSTALTGWTYDPSTYTLTFSEAPSAGDITVTGTGTEYPWLASDLYHWINSLAGQVPYGTSLNPDVKHVDYTEGGIYYYLPAALKAVIVEKVASIEKRYNATALKSAATSYDVTNIGKLWLPSEMEVFGSVIYGDTSKDGLSLNYMQYPIFGVVGRIGARGNAYGWWLINPANGNTTNWCDAKKTGAASSASASVNNASVPICFRIA